MGLLIAFQNFIISFLLNIILTLTLHGEYTEVSLSGVEPLMQKVHNEIRRVDAGILAAVRQQVMIFSYLSFDVFMSIFKITWTEL